MKIIFENIETSTLHNFKGGEKHLTAKMYVDENNKIIDAVLTPNQFVLNNTVAKLLRENQTLQLQCAHVFENGYCIYCDKEQE